eukprot:EG_transcript_4798
MARHVRDSITPDLWVSIWRPVILLQLLVAVVWSSDVEEWVFKEPLKDSYLARFENNTFRHSSANLEFLHETSMVFIGDSLMRYQFMFFLQYLHHRQWDDVFGNSLCCERFYGSYAKMFKAHAALFGCSHICDCADRHVVRDAAGAPQRLDRPWENHYYRNLPLRARASFHFWGGTDLGLKYYLHTPTNDDFAVYCSDFLQTANTHLSGSLESTQKFASVVDFIREVLRPEGHEVLVLNCGIWGTCVPFLTEENLDALAKAAHEAAPIVVWKVTTAVSDRDTNYDSDALLEGLKRRGFHLFDAYALTRGLRPVVKQAMWDTLHFQSFVYRELNIALLQFLRPLLARRRAPHPPPEALHRHSSLPDGHHHHQPHPHPHAAGGPPPPPSAPDAHEN